MASTSTRYFNRCALIPAAILVIILLAAGALLPMPRLLGLNATADPRRIMGWLMLALLAATPVAIGWGSACAQGTQRPRFGLAVLMAALSAVLIGVLWATGRMPLGASVKIAVVLAAWLAFWTLGAFQLGRRGGTGMAVGVTMVIALVLLAAPVSLMPLFRAVSLDYRARTISTAADLCPTFAVLEATGTDYSWMQESVMYGLTGLGQDMPIAYPRWWVAPLIFAIGAMGLALLPRRPALQR